MKIQTKDSNPAMGTHSDSMQSINFLPKWNVETSPSFDIRLGRWILTSHLFWILLGSSRQTSDSVNKIRHCFRRLCKIVDYLSHPTPRKYKIKRIIMTTLKGSLIYTFQKRFTGLPHFFLGFSAKCWGSEVPSENVQTIKTIW